jgi:hypothetical protein
MRRNLIVPLERISRWINTERCKLLADPLSGLDDGPAMQLISRDWLILFGDDQQGEIGRPDADAESFSGGDYAGDKPRERRDPFQVGVTIVGSMLEEGDSRGCSELRGVVQL